MMWHGRLRRWRRTHVVVALLLPGPVQHDGHGLTRLEPLGHGGVEQLGRPALGLLLGH